MNAQILTPSVTGLNQQNSDEHNYINRISSETVFHGVFTFLKSLTECLHCNDLRFARFCPYNTHICNLCGQREHNEPIRRNGPEFRQMSVILKVKSMVSQVTGPIVSSKKRNENPQKNPHERVTKRAERRGKTEVTS